MNKRLALTKDGKLTYYTADEKNIGKGRCNHIAHQKECKGQEEFLNRVNNLNNEENVEIIEKDDRSFDINFMENIKMLNWIVTIL